MSTPLRQNITWPVGRLVWGSVSTMRDKDRNGKPLTTREGKPRQECSFGVAYEKNGTQAFWQTPWGATIYQVGRGSHPGMFQADGNLLPGRKFSWKVIDGDSTVPNENGSIPAQQEGYKGCWIVAYKSAFAPQCFNANGTAPIDAASIKPGHYIQVAGSVDSNNDTQKPGVYVNHMYVAHSGYGPEITSGPAPTSVGFGQGPAPVGMSTIPIGGLPTGAVAAVAAAAATALPPVPGAVTAPPPAVAVPVPVAAPVPLPTPTIAVAPHTGFLQPPGAVVQPTAGMAPAPPVAAPVAPPVAAGPVMLPKAAGVPYASFIAQGWNDSTLRQHGYMA